jgi:hypothetical protein
VARKIIIAVVVLVIALAAFFGGKLFASFNNSPERAAKTFISNLAKADADTTYKQLSANYQKAYARADWDGYVHSLKDYRGEPKLVKSETVSSSFNTYTEGKQPQLFIYEMHINDRTYRTKLIMVKTGKLWKVDDLQGYYAQ